MAPGDTNLNHDPQRDRAWRLVLAFGLVSLFADFTYEGARSIVGPYLAVLGAGPILAGAVAGGGELVGYAVRYWSGRLADRTGRHWLILGVGYALNLLSVPALALAGAVPTASALVFAERFGKGVRNPVRDTLLARAGDVLGHGRAFGLHELLDQSGAVVGPLVVAWAVGTAGYQLGFAVLLVPAVIALMLLARAHAFGVSEVQAQSDARPVEGRSAFIRYLVVAALAVGGFPHFVLVGYHLEAAAVLPAQRIPLLFALAMGADALAAYGVGQVFGRYGMRGLYVVPTSAVIATILLFIPLGAVAPWVGAVAWGIAMGAQETVMRAGVARLSPPDSRAGAYGLFDTVFGSAWMIGSLVFGVLYSRRPDVVAVWSGACEAAALVLLGFWLLPLLKATDSETQRSE